MCFQKWTLLPQKLQHRLLTLCVPFLVPCSRMIRTKFFYPAANRCEFCSWFLAKGWLYEVAANAVFILENKYGNKLFSDIVQWRKHLPSSPLPPPPPPPQKKKKKKRNLRSGTQYWPRDVPVSLRAPRRPSCWFRSSWLPVAGTLKCFWWPFWLQVRDKVCAIGFHRCICILCFS